MPHLCSLVLALEIHVIYRLLLHTFYIVLLSLFYLIITCILFLAFCFSLLGSYKFSVIPVKFFVFSLISVTFIVVWTFCYISYMCLCTWYWILGWSTKKMYFSILPCWMWTIKYLLEQCFNILVANLAMCKQYRFHSDWLMIFLPPLASSGIGSFIL